jgi:hypothetical protein
MGSKPSSFSQEMVKINNINTNGAKHLASELDIISLMNVFVFITIGNKMDCLGGVQPLLEVKKESMIYIK